MGTRVPSDLFLILKLSVDDLINPFYEGMTTRDSLKTSVEPERPQKYTVSTEVNSAKMGREQKGGALCFTKWS